MPTQHRSLRFLLLIAAFMHLPLAHAATGREPWLDTMSTVLPATFCQPTQYFRACFSVSAKACETAAAAATRVCVKRYRDSIPDPLGQAEAEHHSRVLGACTGVAYEAIFASRRIPSKRCDDPQNWR